MQRRYLAIIGFIYLALLCLAGFLGFNVTFALLILSAVFSLASLIVPALKKEKLFSIIALTCFIALSLFSLKTKLIYEPVLTLKGEEAVINATLTDYPKYSNDRYYYIMNINKIEGSSLKNFKVRISSEAQFEMEPYDEFNATVKFSLPTNNSGYSSLQYYKSKGVYLYASPRKIEIVKTDKKPILYYPKLINKKLSEAILNSISPSEANVIDGILLGNDSGIDYNIKENFKASGISHILSVSGTHMSVIAAFLYSFFKKRFLKNSQRLLRLIFTSIGILIFMAITGFEPSVVRSGIMCIMYYLAEYIIKIPDSLNSLGIAVIVITLIDPFSATDIGFLLSVTATLGMALLSGPIYEKLFNLFNKLKFGRKFVSDVCAGIAVSISVGLFTFPVTMLFFTETSLISPLTNILCLPVSAGIIISGLLGSIFYYLGPLAFLKYPFMFIAGILSKIIIWLSDIFSSFTYATISTSYSYVYLITAFILVLVAVNVYFKTSKKLIKATVFVSIAIIITGVFANYIYMRNVVEVGVINQDKGISIVLTKNNRGVVIGCGGAYNSDTRTIQYLKSRGIKNIDFLILPELSENYASKASELAYKIDIDCIVMPHEGDYYDEVNAVSIKKKEHLEDSIITLWDNVKIDTEKQDNGEIIKIFAGETRIVFASKNADVYDCLKDDIYDAIIFENETPANFQNVKGKIAIVSGESEDTAETLLKLQHFKIKGFDVSDVNSYVLQTRGNNDITLRRE